MNSVEASASPALSLYRITLSLTANGVITVRARCPALLDRAYPPDHRTPNTNSGDGAVGDKRSSCPAQSPSSCKFINYTSPDHVTVCGFAIDREAFHSPPHCGDGARTRARKHLHEKPAGISNYV